MALRVLHHNITMELQRNKTAELYLAAEASEAKNYMLTVTLPGTIGK